MQTATAASDPRLEHVGRLSLSEADDLAMAERKVIPIRPLTKYERDHEEIEATRREFLSDRTAALLRDRETFGELLFEVIGSPIANMAVVALRDACDEQGKCWDGISAFGDLMHNAARAKAAQEWPAALLKMAPDCDVCHHSRYERDPAGTGDSPSGYSCTLVSECPWGKTL